METRKFSFSEMLSNSDGKTSGSKVAGMIVVITGCLSLLACTVGLFIGIDVLGFAGVVAGIIVTGAGLMGWSKNQSLKFKDGQS